MEVEKVEINTFGGSPVAEHNMPCAVCRTGHAVLMLSDGYFAPCWSCQEKGWTILNRKQLSWWRRFLVFWIAGEWIKP